MQNKTSCFKKLKLQALSILQMSRSFPNSKEFAPVPLRPNVDVVGEAEIQINDEENVYEQEEFSFACFDAQETLTFADQIFENGKIRPTYTTFHQSPLSATSSDNDTLHVKNLFVVEQRNSFFSQSEGIVRGSYNKISQNVATTTTEDSNKSKKSKSTGSSKTWRFRHSMKLRSNSEGEYAFVIFNPSVPMPPISDEVKEERVFSKKGKGEKCTTTSSPHKKLHLVDKKRKTTIKRKSFLPYRQNLIGFFANVNAFSRHHNPY
ncbi:hypothetical protein VNO78_27227 [Psophocarpus tetragonolobus]|uniref:Uncharacterized protein n=1 Tax=Psophocarpus tetragonolobus TaxID=3891 RepID=A0AAN9XAA0_PSOTE